MVGFSINEPVRVLVVGNDEEYEQVLRTLMGRLRLSSNLETAFLHTLADARLALGSSRVDVVLTDFLLPDGTSAELFQAANEQSPNTQGVILTARPIEEFMDNGAAPANEIWPKEQPNSELRRKMERVLMMRALSRPVSRRTGI